jgi:hypothetical protein
MVTSAAFVVTHVSVVDWPLSIETGLALIEAVGAAAGARPVVTSEPPGREVVGLNGGVFFLHPACSSISVIVMNTMYMSRYGDLFMRHSPF